MDIEKYEFWRPWTSTSPALALPNVSKPSAENRHQHKKDG
jgi:hypothetical protein